MSKDPKKQEIKISIIKHMHENRKGEYVVVLTHDYSNLLKKLSANSKLPCMSIMAAFIAKSTNAITNPELKKEVN